MKLLLFAGMLGLAGSVAREQPPPPASDEVITIDASKNPELVPQWAAWHSAFAFIRGAASGKKARSR